MIYYILICLALAAALLVKQNAAGGTVVDEMCSLHRLLLVLVVRPDFISGVVLVWL